MHKRKKVQTYKNTSKTTHDRKREGNRKKSWKEKVKLNEKTRGEEKLSIRPNVLLVTTKAVACLFVAPGIGASAILTSCSGSKVGWDNMQQDVAIALVLKSRKIHIEYLTNLSMFYYYYVYVYNFPINFKQNCLKNIIFT